MSSIIRFLTVFFSVVSLSVSSGAQNQLDSAPYTPGIDTDIDMYMGSWKESMPRHTHGSLVERDILTRGDPQNPSKKGAVLMYFSRYSHATLFEGNSTTPTTLKGEQEVFYILSGTGMLSGGGKTFSLSPRIAALVPENIEFTMMNTGDQPLTMLLICEPLPQGFRSNTGIIVKDENTIPYTSSNGHWSMIFKDIFSGRDGMVDSSVILVVTFSPMTMGQPHSHGEGFEEVWTTLEGDTTVLLGKQLRKQPVGTAYLVPPDGKTPHAQINCSDRSIRMFHFRRTNIETLVK